MKRTLLSVIAIGTLLIAGLLSCQKEMSNESGGIVTPVVAGTPIPAATPVQGSVSGVVTDENDAPVANAAVTVAGTTYFTNSRGFFNCPPVALDKYFSTVQVNKPGYFKAIRSFCANATRNYVAIKLIPKTLAGNFASGTGGKITLGNGTELNFTASAIVDKVSGTAYTGNVRVYSSYIDPTSGDISARVPGSFVGQDGSKMYSLASAGMLAVELESDAGVPLQLASGKTAAVKLLIPASLLGSAPATIDTWNLNDRGIWIKEATAAKSGNFYEFQASHFSYWNCDIPNSSIYLQLHVTNQDNAPLCNTFVDLKPTSANLWSHCGGLTDSLGNGTAFVPANEVLQLSVYANYNCYGTPAYTQNIGPYTANTNVNIMATVNTTVQQITVQGTAINCNGTPIVSGTALIYAGNMGVYHSTITNGSFSQTILSCSPPAFVSVTATDNTNQQQGNTSTVNVVNGIANTGQLTACGISTSQFINYTLDGANFSISSVNAGASFAAYVNPGAVKTSIYGYDQANSAYINLTVAGNAVGTFPVTNDSLTINNYYTAIPQAAASTTFTVFAPVGQYLEGSFNIPFTDATTGPTVHSCAGTFRVKRIQ
jgi:hypothetical protein